MSEHLPPQPPNPEKQTDSATEPKLNTSTVLASLVAISMGAGVGIAIGERGMDAWDRHQVNKQAKEIISDFNVEDIITCGANPTLKIGGPVKRFGKQQPSVVLTFDVAPGPLAHQGVYADEGDTFGKKSAELKWSPIDFVSKHVINNSRDLPGNAYIGDSLTEHIDSEDLKFKYGSIDPDKSNKATITVPFDPHYEGIRRVEVMPHVTMLTMTGEDINIDMDDRRYDISGEPCATFSVDIRDGQVSNVKLITDSTQE